MGYDQERHMPPPDWVRAMVHPGQKRAAVGDPTLWGNSIRTPIDDDAANAVLGGSPFYGSQIVLAHAIDQYTRSWSLIGSVQASDDVWNDAYPAPPPDSQLAQEGGPRLQVYLSISQGVEKVTIEHLICLVCGGDAANNGLCNQQSTVHGGPYLPRRSEDGSEQVRPFAAIGALIGNTISVRALFLRNTASAFGTPGVIPGATVSVIVAPNAAGTGL